jgi:hypothetical protein
MQSFDYFLILRQKSTLAIYCCLTVYPKFRGLQHTFIISPFLCVTSLCMPEQALCLMVPCKPQSRCQSGLGSHLKARLEDTHPHGSLWKVVGVKTLVPCWELVGCWPETALCSLIWGILLHGSLFHEMYKLRRQWRMLANKLET